MPLYDPHGVLKAFKLQARPEICIGTPESVESYGKEVARSGVGKRRSGDEESVRLIPEPVPVGTPPGWKAFRFTLQKGFYLGTICGVVYDRETGKTVFVMHDTPAEASWMDSGLPFFVTKQDGPEPEESHILIPPNGFVSPELIVADG